MVFNASFRFANWMQKFFESVKRKATRKLKCFCFILNTTQQSDGRPYPRTLAHAIRTARKSSSKWQRDAICLSHFSNGSIQRAHEQLRRRRQHRQRPLAFRRIASLRPPRLALIAKHVSIWVCSRCSVTENPCVHNSLFAAPLSFCSHFPFSFFAIFSFCATFPFSVAAAAAATRVAAGMAHNFFAVVHNIELRQICNPKSASRQRQISNRIANMPANDMNLNGERMAQGEVCKRVELRDRVPAGEDVEQIVHEFKCARALTRINDCKNGEEHQNMRCDTTKE